jgi:hypothetical protein
MGREPSGFSATKTSNSYPNPSPRTAPRCPWSPSWKGTGRAQLDLIGTRGPMRVLRAVAGHP